MRRAILPVSLGLGGLALTVWLVWTLFAGQREDVAIARSFLTLIAEADHAAAEALMTPALSARVGPRGLSELFGQIEPWDHIGFRSRDTNGGGSARRTELFGTGEAQSGCESALTIRMIGGLIDAFNVTPLCLRTRIDT